MPFSAPKLPTQDVLTGHQFQLTIEQLPNVYWTSMSALKETKESGEYNDGVSNRKRYTDGGILSVENITLEIPYDLVTFKAISEWVNTFRDGGVTDITVRPVKFSQSKGIISLSTAFQLGNCRFVSLDAFGDLAKGSTDVSMSKLEISCEYYSVV